MHQFSKIGVLFAFVVSFSGRAATTQTPKHTSAPNIDTAACYAGGWDKARLLTLPAKQFVVSAQERAQLWQQLRFCLAESDPQIRDEVAFGAYSHWLRSGLIEPASALTLLDAVQHDLAYGVDDSNQVYRPFAMLLLSELARLDRVQPYLSASQRQQLVQTVTDFLQQLTDLRGFDDNVGWRHGVAHAADAVMQLSLNSAISAAQLLQLRDALTRHVAPLQHGYIDGEPARLARAFVYLQQRPEISAADWQQWLTHIAAQAPVALYQSRQGLTYLHNSRAFFLECLWLLEQFDDGRAKPFRAWIQAQLKQ